MKTHYRIHRWLAIPLGLFLALQCVTGAMYLFSLPGEVEREHPEAVVDWSDVAIAPREAAGDDPATQVLLYRVGDVPVYEISPVGTPTRFVDARDGSKFALDQEGARRVAESAVATDAAVRSVRRIGAYEFEYHIGHLPGFHTVFEDGSEVYVEGPSGRVTRVTNGVSSFRDLCLRIHDFDAVRFLTRRERLTHLSLIFLSGLCCIAIASGYNILWQQRRVRKRAARQRRHDAATTTTPPRSPDRPA